uniref:Magnesium-dependent phosphatase 1 n=1 Tax=Anthurium amnicola TaxID=1678845 RepID=A0A1D1XHM9_9ARAE
MVGDFNPCTPFPRFSAFKFLPFQTSPGRKKIMCLWIPMHQIPYIMFGPFKSCFPFLLSINRTLVHVNSHHVILQEIFSSWTHKTEHFQRIHQRTGVPFKSMLFFDDEDRNIEAVSNMGVTSIYVGNGVNLEALRLGLKTFAQNSVPPSTNEKG